MFDFDLPTNNAIEPPVELQPTRRCVYDQLTTKIGCEMESKQEPLHVVGAILLKGDRILLARRAAHKSAAGMWEFPGGKVDPGESPSEALAREIHEELGLQIKVNRTFDVSDTVLGEAIIRLETMVCEVDGEFDGVSSDHDAFMWAEVSDLDSLDWPKPDLPAVFKLRALGRLSELEAI
jgi:8-oxo-dGTP diphosphatase